MTSRHTLRGFTLIELLVVLVIIAILTGMAVISVGALGRDPPAKKAAAELAEMADLVSQEAVMRGTEYGIRVEPHAYQFLLYDGRAWKTPQDDSLFVKHDFGDDVELNLKLEGTPLVLAPAPATTAAAAAATGDASPSAASDDSNTLKPQILFLSSGELTPFELTFSGIDKDASYTVKGSLVDGIQQVTPDDNSKH